MENQQQKPVKKEKKWTQSSLMVKIGIIGILMVWLLLLSVMIQSIIEEREELKDSVTREVSSKWAEQQQIKGPILTIPLSMVKTDKEGNKQEYTEYWHVLPEHLKINGNLTSETLHRGIYDAIVYRSKLKLSGIFHLKKYPNFMGLKKRELDQAFITVGISDLKGIEEEIKANWNDVHKRANPGTKLSQLASSGFTIPVKVSQEQKEYHFDFEIDLQGSKNLSFLPVGAVTEVELQSPYTAPSFTGEFLPDFREVSENGFIARWKVLKLNRNFPQMWTTKGVDYSNNINHSDFGVDLIIQADDYQKSLRSAKYGILTIGLTFLIFFLVEVVNKTQIHPLQYAMVGVALCLFYTLLVAISEHSSFNIAFGISAVAIVSMISLYSVTLFHKWKLSLMLMTFLYGIFSFLFITLQMVDYALLMGSVGLTVILGLTMFFTRKIDWYQISFKQ
ncbi:cell envelope integrity protein CreD [Flammeovirga sp. SR4]|uniref:Cell envelope integrity protein CreD n=2 Tax=Flammeovirga agarivorans TaxID=2726742 RepID=A0A7X8XTZ2_9BACT|nr:cell envelope integrity protein CreD [Flammeovirga agarivorans]